MPHMRQKGWVDSRTGVAVMPLDNRNVSVSYSGLLASSGADRVFLHCGQGTHNNSWHMVRDIPMDRTGHGFKTTILVEGSAVQVCFKDSANNWDNNNGFNWTINPV